jgi:hypothetical protein
MMLHDNKTNHNSLALRAEKRKKVTVMMETGTTMAHGEGVRCLLIWQLVNRF